MHICIYGVIIILVILDIYWIRIFIKMNKELKKEVADTKEWCNGLISDIVNQEIQINELLFKVLNDLNDNKVSRDVINIANSGDMCKYHMKVYNDLKDEQKRIGGAIIDIKNRQDELIDNTIDKINSKKIKTHGTV